MMAQLICEHYHYHNRYQVIIITITVIVYYCYRASYCHYDRSCFCYYGYTVIGMIAVSVIKSCHSHFYYVYYDCFLVSMHGHDVYLIS